MYNRTMPDLFSEITKLGHAVLRKTRLSNAMGTPLALVVLVTIPCLGIYVVSQSWPALVLGSLPVVYFLRAFEWLMKNDRSMLRTEEHEEKMLQISVGLGESGKKELAESKVINMESTTNPTSKAISRGSK